MGKPKGGAAMGGLERRGGGWLIGGVVLIPDLGFHQKKGHANEQGGSVCLSALPHSSSAQPENAHVTKELTASDGSSEKWGKDFTVQGESNGGGRSCAPSAPRRRVV
jgi:hypothetical protein